MPSYVETWDPSKPAGTRDLSLGDDDIREFKRAIQERLNEDHVHPSDETGFTTVGYHRKTTLIKQGSNATAVTDTYILYCKNDGSTDELFGIDESGNVIQFTDAGKLAVLGSEGWRTGDKLLSSNTNTPTGWTDQSATYTDNFIRISSGTPLTTGGTDTHDHGAATGSTTLTAAQSGLPAHTHTVPARGNSSVGTVARAMEPDTDNANGANTLTTDSTGGSAASSGHTHTVSSANNVPVYVQMKMYSKT